MPIHSQTQFTIPSSHKYGQRSSSKFAPGFSNSYDSATIREMAKNTEMTDLSQFSYNSYNSFKRRAPRRPDGAGWKIAAIGIGLASVPLAIAAKSLAPALVGGAVSLALAFGSDG